MPPRGSGATKRGLELPRPPLSFRRARPGVPSPALLASPDFCLQNLHPSPLCMLYVLGWGGVGGEVSAGVNNYFILLLLQSFSLTAKRLIVSQKKGKASLFWAL